MSKSRCFLLFFNKIYFNLITRTSSSFLTDYTTTHDRLEIPSVSLRRIAQCNPPYRLPTVFYVGCFSRPSDGTEYVHSEIINAVLIQFQRRVNVKVLAK